jgi:hypothetical protein
MRTIPLLAIALLLAGSSMAQPVSFRSMSTGGLILDDLDQWASGILFAQPVPDRLLDLQGVRVYTGLSNLSTGDDMMFSESGESTRGSFLLGGSWSPVDGSFGLGALAEFLKDRTYEALSLNGPGGLPFLSGSGELEGQWSQYTDSDDDGTLDTRHTVCQSVLGWSDTTLTSAGAFGAYRAGESLQIGLGVSMLSVDSKTLGSDLNFTTTVTDSNLVTGMPTYRWEDTGTGSDEESRTALSVAASGKGAVTDVIDLGGMFLFSMLSSDITHEQVENGAEDELPGQSGVFDLLTWSTAQNYTVSPGGNRFGGGMDMGVAINEDWKLEMGAAYYTMSMDGSSLNYSMQTDSARLITSGSLVDSLVTSVDGTGGTDINLSESSILTGAKLTTEPAAGLVISMGAGFAMFDNSNTVRHTNSMMMVRSHSDGDQQFADPDDWVATTTWSQTEETRTTTETMKISIPVGIEFEVLPRLSARLGASPAFVWEKETDTSTLLAASPMITTTVSGNGDESQSVEDPWTTYDGTLISTDETYTEIPYTYGVGYSASDFLQVDLMGLSSDLSKWRLSATLSF